MKRRISAKIRWARFLMITIGIGLVFAFVNSILSGTLDMEQTVGIFIFLIISGVLFYLLDKAKSVEFDNKYMYVIDKYGEEKIPLKDVYKIKLTTIKINNRNMWKICYHNTEEAERSIRILPRWFHKHFDDFKNSVRNSNEDVKIKNWSHSFDIDQ